MRVGIQVIKYLLLGWESSTFSVQVFHTRVWIFLMHYEVERPIENKTPRQSPNRRGVLQDMVLSLLHGGFFFCRRAAGYNSFLFQFMIVHSDEDFSIDPDIPPDITPADKSLSMPPRRHSDSAILPGRLR